MNHYLRKSLLNSSFRKAESRPVCEGLEPRLFLAADPTFATLLAEEYVISTEGYGLTIGIDGADVDDQALSITFETADPNLDVYVAENCSPDNLTGNRLHGVAVPCRDRYNEFFGLTFL